MKKKILLSSLKSNQYLLILIDIQDNFQITKMFLQHAYINIKKM